MFLVEPILFLQSLAGDAFTAFMVLVSRMGYTPFYVTVLSFLMFGVDFRKGFLITQMVLWNGMLTDLFKNLIAIPRPSDVESTIRLLGTDHENSTPFTGMGGRGFFGLPAVEAIRFFRELPGWSFGFPSGHVSGTATLWGGLSLAFRKKQVWILGAIVFLLMPLSRMYLGRHFLADVLGGFLLAGTLVVFAYFLLWKDKPWIPLLETAQLCFQTHMKTWLLITGLLIPPLLLLLFVPLIEPGDAGRLFGMNAAFLIVGFRGFPNDAGSVLKRILRFLLSPILFFTSQMLLSKAVDLSPLNEDHVLVEFILSGLVAYVMLWGTVWVSVRTGLYMKESEVSNDIGLI